MGTVRNQRKSRFTRHVKAAAIRRGFTPLAVVNQYALFEGRKDGGRSLSKNSYDDWKERKLERLRVKAYMSIKAHGGVDQNKLIEVKALESFINLLKLVGAA